MDHRGEGDASIGESRDPRYASVDSDASAARAWLTAQFDAQQSRGDAAALSRQQRTELRSLLDGLWWQSAVSTDPDGATDDTALILRVVPATVRAAAAIPEGGLVLALYLRNLINYAWSMAWDHSTLRTAVDTACTTASGIHGSGSAQPADLLSRCGWQLLRFMEREFAVETALLTGRLSTVLEEAALATAAIGPIVEQIVALPDSPGKAALEREARNELTYYRAVHETAQLGRRLLQQADRPDVGPELADIRARIGQADFHRMDASELRGHLTAVEAVNDSRDRDWLHVDSGRIRIMFPFAIPARPGATTTSLIASVHDLLQQRLRSGRPFGSHHVTSISRRLNLSDVWQGADSFNRSYRGATVELRAVTLEEGPLGTGQAANPSTPASESDFWCREVIQPHIEFSELGNHMVVFDLNLEDAPANRVAEALHLATPVFGDLLEVQQYVRMTTSDGTRVAGLPNLVQDLLLNIDRLIREVEREAGLPDLGTDRVLAREGSFGILVTVTGASRSASNGTSTPLTKGQDILRLWGVQPLLHPLPSGVASVADWALQDLDTVQRWPLLHLNGELLASNSNMTLLVSLSSPDFAVKDMESYISFTHSLHGLFHGWQQRVNYFAERIAHLLREAEALLEEGGADAETAESLAVRRQTIAVLDSLVRDAETTELSLQSFIQSAEAVMLFIESPDLVSSPPLREDLDTILASNGYQRLRSEFTRAVQDVLGTRLSPLLDVVHRRMEQSLAEESQLAHMARQRRLEVILQVASIFFGVIGFSGLAGILQAGHPSWGSDVSWWLIAVIIARGGLAVLPVAMLHRPHGKWRKGG